MDPTQSFAVRAKRTFTRMLVTLLVLALIAAVGFLMSQLNARTYSLEVSEGKLWVKKGRMMPYGSQPFRSSDPALVDAYAPLELHGFNPGTLTEQRFTEREELDRALFQLVEQLARPRILSDDPKTLEEGLTYLRRAEKLQGITEEQRRTLKQMQADVAYYQARARFEDARRLLAEALTQLKLAATSENRHARSANQMITEVEPLANQLTEALRKSVYSLSAPPDQQGQQPAAEPQPTQPQQPTPEGKPATP
jgi:hypothetical protein